MRSFRAALALRTALGTLGIVAAISLASVLALRSLLYRQLDGTLLHLAEVEAQAGADASSSDFAFHEGVLLASREGSAAELTRYAQLWDSDGRPLVRTHNLTENLPLPLEALEAARAEGGVAWATQTWRGRTLRSAVYPLRLVGAAHGTHLLQVAAPLEPVQRTVSQFALLVAAFAAGAAALAYAAGWQVAGAALRPTREITEHARALEAGSLSERITAHADVTEFESLVTVLNGMLDRLDRAFRVQRRFTADASHELRAPLYTLRGDIELALKRERTAAEYRETLVRCREEVLGLSRLAENLLALARSDAGLAVEHTGEVDLYALVGQVAARYTKLAAERQVRIDLAGDPALTVGDARLLSRVVGNLLENALRFSPAQGTVYADIRNGVETTLTVRDEGPGISPDQVPQLFTRFFRGDPARPRAEGTGLGLAIAQAGAQAHGGRIEFLGNAPGAVFRLSLPPVVQQRADRPDLSPTLIQPA